MKLSTRARYAARALAELASLGPDATMSVRDVAQKQHISDKYLEQILKPLRSAGIVKAARGMRGGYALARPAASITLKELFQILEGSVAPVHCVDDPNSCSMADVCPTRETWVEVRDSVEAVLERTTIQDLVERKKQKAVLPSMMYHI